MSQFQGITLPDFLHPVFVKFREIDLQQFNGLCIGNHRGSRVAVKHFANHAGVVRFHVQDDQVIQVPSVKNARHFFHIGTVTPVFNGIQKCGFCVFNQVGIV